MTEKFFPNRIVFACVALSKNKNIPFDQKEMVPLVSFLSGLPEEELHDPEHLRGVAANCGMWLARYYTEFDTVPYPDGNRGDQAFDSWWKRGVVGDAKLGVDSPKGTLEAHLKQMGH